jgi:hypothetical protein
MHYFLDRTTGEELSEALFRRVNRKRASFGDVLDAEVAASLGYDFVELADPPSYDSSSHKIVKAGRTPVSGNTFAQGWDIVPLSSEELDARTEELAQRLAQAKASKRADITQAAIRADLDSFEFGGKRIAVDDASMRRIAAVSMTVALLGEFPEGWPGRWRAMDNTAVEIPDVDTWKAFIRAMAKQGAANFARQMDIKSQVEASTSLSQVEQINW